MSTRVLDLDDVGTPVSRDDDDDDDDTDAGSARRASASPASTSKRRRTRDGDDSSTPCAFFLRGRCASGDACPRAHVRASATHAMNCGCPRCRPRRADDDGASESDDESEEEGAVPRAVVAREAEERLDRRAAIIAECAVVSAERAVTFWREFLRRAATEEGNKLTPYWTPRRAADGTDAGTDAK